MTVSQSNTFVKITRELPRTTSPCVDAQGLHKLTLATKSRRSSGDTPSRSIGLTTDATADADDDSTTDHRKDENRAGGPSRGSREQFEDALPNGVRDSVGGAVRCGEAVACGFLGCRTKGPYYRVEGTRGTRVLCAEHVPGWCE